MYQTFNKTDDKEDQMPNRSNRVSSTRRKQGKTTVQKPKAVKNKKNKKKNPKKLYLQNQLRSKENQHQPKQQVGNKWGQHQQRSSPDGDENQ